MVIVMVKEKASLRLFILLDVLLSLSTPIGIRIGILIIDSDGGNKESIQILFKLL